MLRRSCSHLTLAFFIALVSASLCTASAPNPEKDLTVNTTAGQIKGVARAGGGAEFLGIPYAQPPIGNLRWHEPAPAKPWSSIRDATKFGAPCSQPDLGDWNRRDAETG
jgi:para-nitrobenzyl esterase